MYKLIYGFDGIFRVSDGATIPNEPTLLAWQEYEAWLDAGNKPLPADPQPK